MASAALAVDVLAMGADERNIELLGAGRAPAASDGPLAAAVAVCGDSRLEEPFNFHTEACKILGLAVPVALSNLFEYLPVLFLVAAVGHLPHSEEALAATALGRNFFNSWWGIAWGFTSALHTLAPQAEGAGRADLHALHAQRAALILTLLCVPLGLVQVFSGGILRLLGQDPVVSAAAAPFAIRLIPRLFAESYFTILQRVGQAMGHASAVAAVTMIGFVCSALFLWLFIDMWHLGYLGAAWACVAWNGLNTVALAMFLFRQRGPGRGRSLFVPYKPFRDVLSCAGLRETNFAANRPVVCLEWWAIDLGVMLAAGILPDPTLNLGANAVVSSVADLNYMVWLGVQGATSIMVGKHVGSGRPEAARRTIRVAVFLGFLCAGLVSFGLVAGRHAIAASLTESPAVREKAAKVLLVLAVQVFADSTNCVLGGALRGMGRQARGVQSQFCGFVLVGFPVGALLLSQYRDTEFGLECLWIAVICAALTSGICAGVYIARADWDAVLWDARARNE
mmetsp:Transcript_145571/g.466567  ORF Transcript_145571/g.466567 Transcript_145571/m.466567 type:complete len:510 (+) Transcript_145571:103-1632(+)